MKKLRNILLVILINIIIILVPSISKAESVNEITNEQAEGIVTDIMQQFGEKGLTKGVLSDAIEQYEELSKKYSNQDIVNMIENAKVSLQDQDINTKHFDTVEKVLKNFDEEQLNVVLNKLNIDEALNDLEDGATILQLIEKTTSNMSTTEKTELVLMLAKSSNVLRKIIAFIIILILYKLLVRCVIYKKAGKKPWAVIIPIYKDAVMLRICKMSPAWLLLILIPIIGWAILWVVKVASKFMLAEAFDKSEVFGLGLWLLWPIFEGILAFSKKSKYVGIE